MGIYREKPHRGVVNADDFRLCLVFIIGCVMLSGGLWLLGVVLQGMT